jgi:hypothetical protein
MASSTPGRKLSIKICAPGISRVSSSTPRGWRGLSVTLFLLRAYTFHQIDRSFSFQCLRVSPTTGGSTLMTSAPKSASCRVSMFPAMRRERSRTRTP